MKFGGVLVGEDNFVTEKSSTSIQKAWGWLTGLVFGEAAPKRLMRPHSGAVSKDGNRIYVTDIGRKAVFVFDKKKGRLDVWESATSNVGFISPIAIVENENNEILVSDADLGAVFVLTPSGEPVRVVGLNDLKRPTGLAYDAKSKLLFVADSSLHQVLVFNESGEKKYTIGKKGGGDAAFNAPTHIDLHEGRLYVVDTLNSRVQVFNQNGEYIKHFGKRGLYLGDMPRPKGITVDSAGRVFVVESYYDYLLVYNTDGEFLLPIGGSGNLPGQFFLPAGVWSDGKDNVFVADMFNGRVVQFEMLGKQDNKEQLLGMKTQ
ncbi:MAG: 6-bladed beta-propeller [Gammaproteobacteria bacterium]|nr:6-bladed beta-propeller [Gammaproteobacteria bacterium]